MKEEVTKVLMEFAEGLFYYTSALRKSGLAAVGESF